MTNIKGGGVSEVKEFFLTVSLSEAALSVRKKSCVPPSIGGDFFR